MAKEAKKKDRKPSAVEVWARQNPTRAMVALMVVLLGLRIALMVIEPAPSREEAMPQATALPTAIDISPLERVKERRANFDESKYAMLTTTNIFNAREVIEADTKVSRARTQYESALRAYSRWEQLSKNPEADAQKNAADALAEAQTAVKAAIEEMPSHQPARRLEKNILAALEPEAPKDADSLAEFGQTAREAGDEEVVAPDQPEI